MSQPCILCLNTNVALTDEHIFPEAAGGTLSFDLLCQPCNSKLGQFVDAPYVKQKHIELFRAVHRIAGKTGHIPQPFSDTYQIETKSGPTKVRLDNDFHLRVVPGAPEIWLSDHGGIGVRLSRDVKNKANIPNVIRAALTRFLKTEQGLSLGWTDEEKENAIRNSIADAEAVQPTSEPIEVPICGSWEIDFKVLFSEHVKVIYEVSCLEYGQQFIKSDQASRIRKFLLSKCTGKMDRTDLSEVAVELGIVPEINGNLVGFIDHITRGKRLDTHLALVTPDGVICSMLGIGAIFGTKGIGGLAFGRESSKAYVSSINGIGNGIFAFHDILHEAHMHKVTQEGVETDK